MAIYSLNLGFISRSEGRSSVGFGAYISGSKSYDQRTGVAYDYSNKREVIVSRILAPDGSPDWAKNAHTLWNTVEQFEDHIAALRFKGDPYNKEKNQRSLEAKAKFLASTQTAQTVMGAIPIELNKEQAETCIEEFLQDRFVSRGLVAHYAIHWERNNPHFHAQITRRSLIDGEFSQRKDHEIVSKPEHKLTRKTWEQVANKHLTLAGHEVRIDCRSNAERGSLFVSTHHEGWYAQRLAERGQYSRLVADNESIRQRNIEIMCERPEALIHEIALKRTPFTRKHIEEEIIRRVGGDEKLFSLLKAKVDGIEIPAEQILKTTNDDVVYDGFASDLSKYAAKLADSLLSNKQVVYKVGNNLDRGVIYASAAYKRQEASLVNMATLLNQRQDKGVEQAKIEQGIQNLEKRLSQGKEIAFKFFDEQREAIHHLCSGSDIRILNGKAGTGKTTLLQAVAEIYAQEGYRVLGTSFQGKAVEIMSQEIGIPCRTLHSFEHAWDKYAEKKALVESGRLWGRPLYFAIHHMKQLEESRFTAKDVIIVDEANMIGGSLWGAFLKEATSQGAKVLIVQDPSQIKSREAGDYGRLFADKFGFCETKTVVRQKVEWQRQCSELLNDHQVLDGLSPYQEEGHIHWLNNHEEVKEQLVQDYLQAGQHNPNHSRMILAYRNAQVYELNQQVRQNLITSGQLREHFKFDKQDYSIGERIRFTENDNHGSKVKNEVLSRHDLHLLQGVKNGSFGTIVGFDEKYQTLKVRLDEGRVVRFTADDYPHITLGYAMSLHKSEGSTFDRTFVAPDPLMDPSTILVAMTRHRYNTQMYVDREQFVDFKALVDQLSYGGMRETLQDYQVSEAQHPYLENVQTYKDLMAEVVNLREEMEASLKPSQPLYKHPTYEAYQLLFEQKQQVSADILKDWDRHLPFVKLAGLRRDVLEVEAGLRPRLLSELEHRASIQVQSYMDVTRQTRELWKTISETHPGTLAASHELYADYKTLKTERDSLAAVFNENPKLYKQFFVYTKEGEGQYKDFWEDKVAEGDRVCFSSVKHHAEAHLHSQLRNIHYAKLSEHEKDDYQQVESYLTARNQAATIYSQLKKQEEQAVQSTEQPLITFEKFKAIQALRDTLALEIINDHTRYQPHLDHLKVKEDKLIEHAQAGEVRFLIAGYIAANSVGEKSQWAEHLKSIMDQSKFRQLMKEDGIDFNRLTFDIAFYQGVTSGQIKADQDPDTIYKPIKSYLDNAKTAARVWNVVQAKAKEDSLGLEPIEAMKQSTQKLEWLVAIIARNENAKGLSENSIAVNVLKGMRPGIETRLHKQAQKAEIASRYKQNYKAGVYEQRQVYISSEAVLEAAKGRYADLVPRILGHPNSKLSNKSQIRFGSSGKFVFSIAGSKEGLWHDFSAQEGGNIFQLIQREKNLSYKESVEYLARELNVTSRAPVQRPSFQQKTYEPTAEELKEKTEKLETVNKFYKCSQPILGTLAEHYLRQERGIKCELSPDLRFIPKGFTFRYDGKSRTLAHNCFAAFGRQANGELSVVQVTKLNPDGTRAHNEKGEKLKKIQYGVSKGSFVTLQEGTNRTFIAEGLETALSIKETGVKGRIVSSLGIYNICNYKGSEKTIVICSDNDDDKPTSGTHKTIQKASTTLQEKGYTVDVIKSNIPGQDFNDVLNTQGVKGVTEYIKPYLEESFANKNKSLNQTTEIKPSAELVAKAADYFEGLFKNIKSANDSDEKKELIETLKTKMKILAKQTSLIAEIKAINEPVGTKLEEIHLKMRENEQMRPKSRGLSL